MKPSGKSSIWRWGAGRFATALLGLALLIPGGCRTPGGSGRSGGAGGQPARSANVYRESDYLPGNLQRVAVLPLTAEGSTVDFDHGRTTLQPVLLQELGKAGRFEIVEVSSARLKSLTGREGWLTSDALPPSFFRQIRETTGCDAVLFAHLTRYQPYPPVVVGWRLTLADASTARIWWAADEVTQAPGPKRMSSEAWLLEGLLDGILPTGGMDQRHYDSPRWLAQVSLSTLIATLPER